MCAALLPGFDVLLVQPGPRAAFRGCTLLVLIDEIIEPRLCLHMDEGQHLQNIGLQNILQRLKGMLDGGGASSEAREGVLKTLAAAGSHLASPGAQLLLLAVLLGSLDDGSAVVRSSVAELLEGAPALPLIPP